VMFPKQLHQYSLKSAIYLVEIFSKPLTFRVHAYLCKSKKQIAGPFVFEARSLLMHGALPFLDAVILLLSACHLEIVSIS
jgi:hypothetical protein